MAWHQAQSVGDTDPLIPNAKQYLSRFSYGKNLGGTNVYTTEFAVALLQWQANIHTQVAAKRRPGPDVNLIGVFDWATKKQMGLIVEPTKPVIFTVAGHLGDMFTGPAYFTARWLEERGLVKVQPIGYENTAIPFQNRTGIDELNRCVNDPVILPPGTPWMLMAHSQGAIVASSYFLDVIRVRQDQAPYNKFQGAIMFGNPYRQQGVVASWIADPPPFNTQGISNRRMTDTPPTWQECARKGDLYATNTADKVGEYKTAIYRAVVNEWTGQDSLTEQVGELVLNFGPEVLNVFKAIVSGVQGAASLDQHNLFDLGPCIDYARQLLKI